MTKSEKAKYPGAMTRYMAIIPAETKRGLDAMARSEMITTSALVRRILVKAEREGRKELEVYGVV